MPRKKKAKRGRPKKRRGRPRKKAGGVRASGTTSARLAADLRSYHGELAGKCDEIQREMAAISDALSALGGAAPAARAKPGRKRGRPAKSGVARRGPRPAGTSLKDHIGKVLKASSKPVSVKNMVGKVVRGGYQTKSSNLANQISMALAQMVKARQAKKVSRGMYTA